MERRAVSLVEVLVAIAILVALSLVVLVVSLHSRRQGRVAACLSNLHQIDLAIRGYAADYDDTTPPISINDQQSIASWKKTLALYSDDGVFYCPSDLHARKQTSSLGTLVGPSIHTSYSHWQGAATVPTERLGYNVVVLSSIESPATTKNMNDYTAPDRSRCLEDEYGAYHPNYSAHGPMLSLLYWDGHAAISKNEQYETKNRLKADSCP